MQLTTYLSLLAFALVTVLTFYGHNVDACMCMPSHPQTDYCNADYVVQLRVLRKSERLVANKVVYKVQVKRAYKINEAGHKLLRHGRLITGNSEAMCGLQLKTGRVYVIAGKGKSINMCNYAKEYTNMTIIERYGFAGAYRKGCKCTVKPCFGNQCLEPHETIDSCNWSPFAKCETTYSACTPATYRTPEGTFSRCHWRRTEAYKKCMHDP